MRPPVAGLPGRVLGTFKEGFFPFQEDEDDKTVLDLAVVLFETATLRSGYLLPDTKAYGDRIERMLRLSLNIDPDAKVCAPGLVRVLAGWPVFPSSISRSRLIRHLPDRLLKMFASP